MPAVLSKYITTNPKILGGTPTISGTRIPVKHIILLVKRGYNPQMLYLDYPQINTNKWSDIIFYLMQAGLDVYEKDKEEISHPG